MNTCKNCKWWGVDFDNTCDFVKTISASIKATQFKIEVNANDDTDLEGHLVTGPDFGCIHFLNNY